MAEPLFSNEQSHKHDAKNSVMSKPHKYENGSYVELTDEELAENEKEEKPKLLKK